MSDENASTPENSPQPEAAPRARRVSTPRPKKVAKVGEAPIEPSPHLSTEQAPTEVFESSESPKSHTSENDWPEPEPDTSGNQSQTESAKRKRRRRKGKGKSDASQNAAPSHQENPPVANAELLSEPFEQPAHQAPRPPAGPQPVKGPQPQHHQQPRAKVDPELLTKMAWKIYLAEVSEEGVALIGDNDAKDLSRRCFRLAEIFIEEQSRRR